MRGRRTFLLYVAALAVTRSQAQAPSSLTVSAAASLTDVLKAGAPDFEAKHSMVLRFNFGASGALLQQIMQGAPVDVFVSADDATVERGIAGRRLIAASRRDIAGNTLVLIASTDAVGLAGPQGLTAASISRIAIGKPLTVPAGRYAQQALESAGLWSAVQARLVYADSVRQVLDYVARGDAEAGFVYATDARLMHRARERLVPSARNQLHVRPPLLASHGRRVARARMEPPERQRQTWARDD
jgi:molybdate transport system substrate-binding protein